MLDLNRRTPRRYSDNGEIPDRNPNAAHPARSLGTWVAVAIGGSAVVGAGASMYSANKAAKSASMPSARDFNAEISALAQQNPQLTAQYLQNQQANQGLLSSLNSGTYANLLRGNFDAGAFEASNPGFQQFVSDAAANGQMQGWTPAQMAAAFTGRRENDPALAGFYSGGVGQLLRDSYRSANPELTGYTGGLLSSLNSLNAQGAARYDPSGFQASGYQAALAGNASAGPALTAGYGPAQATGARYNAAAGGPLLGTLERNAGASLGVSSLQNQQQQIASRLLSSGGALSQSELQGAQDAARSAYASRGLIRSSRGIGAEILATDQAQRQRMLENLSIAQGVDAAGQQQLNQNRNYALGVQGQRQALNTFNSGQQNQLGQYNAGLLADTSRYNAGLGAQTSQFNAAQGNAQNQYNAGLLAQLGMFNATQQNQAGQYNSNAANQTAQFNATASNDANRYNAGLLAANQNDQWARQLQYAGLLQSQAIDPQQTAALLFGASQAPDYTQALLGYGSDLYGTNYNAGVSAANSARNNSAALTASGLGLLGSGISAYGNYRGLTAGTGGAPRGTGSTGLNPADNLPW